MFPQIIESGATVVVPAGVSYLTVPVKLTGKDIRIVGEDGAVLRGTVKLSRADFQEIEPGVWSAPVRFKADAFYIGRRKYSMARYPKADDPEKVFGGYAADCILPEKTRNWANPTGGYVHAMHLHHWGGYIYRIDGKNEDHTLRLSGGWQNNRQMGMHEEYRYAENIREEMTRPGEWYFDEAAMRVYVRLIPGDDLEQAEIAVSRGFFVLENCENVTIENITFERSVRTFMDTKEPLLRSDWTIYRGGAILAKNSKNCGLDRCRFFDIGSNGVFVDGNCEDIRVTRTRFADIGASAVCFVGWPDSVRSPLFEYNERQSIQDIDLEPGPKSQNYPKNCLVEDCLIEKVGVVERQATGVQISMAYGVTVKNCTVCHTSRSGINISEGTFGGHRIEGCDVFDTVRETGDHGSFNSWGRDRFWNLGGVEDRDVWKYAMLDMIAPNVITRSRFRCDRGWDIDLDDGSSNFIITENLCLSGGIKLREGFFRTVRNNIMVNNTLHTHAWYPCSGDVAENNIMFADYAPYAMPDRWGKRIDGNIFVAAGQLAPTPAENLAAISGQDRESVCLDPLFRDPMASDYRPQNPDVRGFENFPTEFGVGYAPLRAIADIPILPVPAQQRQTTGEKETRYMSMKVKNIETDGEMSVFGTAGHNGALVLAVEPGGQAESRGLQAGDVIVAWGDRSIARVTDLEGCTFAPETLVAVLRKQQRIEL